MEDEIERVLHRPADHESTPLIEDGHAPLSETVAAMRTLVARIERGDVQHGPGSSAAEDLEALTMLFDALTQ